MRILQFVWPILDSGYARERRVLGDKLGRNEPQIRINSGPRFSFASAAFSPQRAYDLTPQSMRGSPFSAQLIFDLISVDAFGMGFVFPGAA
jgi:hypothetical protein